MAIEDDLHKLVATFVGDVKAFGVPGPTARDLVRMASYGHGGGAFEGEYANSTRLTLANMVAATNADAEELYRALVEVDASGILPVKWEMSAPTFPPGVRVLVRYLAQPQGIPSWLVEDLIDLAQYGWRADRHTRDRLKDQGVSPSAPFGLTLASGRVCAESAAVWVSLFLYGADRVVTVDQGATLPGGITMLVEAPVWYRRAQPYSAAEVAALAETSFGGVCPVFDAEPPSDPAVLTLSTGGYPAGVRSRFSPPEQVVRVQVSPPEALMGGYLLENQEVLIRT